jgi:phosphoglycerol transferase MdoB-like AlkP superfamily enzyme
MADDKSRGGLASVTTRALWRPEVTIVFLVIALLLQKLKLMRPAARGHISFAVVQHDGAIFALLLLLYVAGSAIASRNKDNGIAGAAAKTFSKLCILAFLLVVLLYAADVAAYQFFITRLYARDIVTFSSEGRGVLSLLRSGWRVTSARPAWRLAIDAALALLLLRACCVLLARPVLPLVRGGYLVGAALALAIFWRVPVPDYVYSFTDRALFENFIERNHNFYVRNTFSDAFRAQILAAPPTAMNCEPGRGRRLNVILLIVESLSAYHSHFFSGVEDWTPNLDAIARRETALTNFHANGWTTTGGLVSLLTGTLPLVPELRTSRTTAFTPIGGTSLTDYLDVPRTLPRTLSEQGYATEFVAPGDLKFVGQDKWLPAVGFQKIVSGDDPRFAAQKRRGPFNSVPDRLLYSVALNELTQMPADKPYFMVVQTFWSHRPFMDPDDDGKLNGEERVFRDSDAQIGAFYERLRAAGFFQNGLLFITGDHRAPEPFQKVEFERFGASAAARIPGVIATRAVDLPQVLAQDFQQRDFPASIEALVGDRYCLGPQEGSFLSNPPMPPSCIIQARGDDRDLIYVKCGTAEGTVRATGDATRFVSGGVPDEPSIIQTINRTRARPSTSAKPE